MHIVDLDAGLSIYAFGIGVANAGLVRLTLFTSEMSKVCFCRNGYVADDYFRFLSVLS